MEPTFKPLDLSFPLPKLPHLNLHAHVSFMGSCTMVHLTTTDVGGSQGSLPPMGSFVYAMPDMRNERNAISTSLSTSSPSIDYATRMAKILARKMKQPVYVGCSMTFADTAAEEEMEGFTAIVDHLMRLWEKR